MRAVARPLATSWKPSAAATCNAVQPLLFLTFTSEKSGCARIASHTRRWPLSICVCNAVRPLKTSFRPGTCDSLKHLKHSSGEGAFILPALRRSTVLSSWQVDPWQVSFLPRSLPFPALHPPSSTLIHPHPSSSYKDL